MRLFALLIPALLLAACGSPATEPTVAFDLPTAQVLVTETVAVATALPFEAATYRDAEAGFELQYPAAWFVIGGETQSRGSYVQIVSWDAGANGITETPTGESVLQITIYQWDPTHDLDARVSMRRSNFVDSGNVILEEEQLSLGGQPAVRFLLQATDGSQALFLMLELGDRYLEVSGTGDIATLDAAMRTLVIDAPSE
ncbi:MAG: hypothetical protein WD751_10150 [Anaerolineales bacterium]